LILRENSTFTSFYF